MKQLLVFLLLPPVNLVLAILVGVALLRRWPRLARWVIGVAALLLLALAMPAVGGTMLCALERNLPMTPPGDKPPGAIVILGGDVTHTDGARPDGARPDGAHTDGAHTDGAHTDGGHTDGAHTDGGHTDGGHTDGGHTDGGRAGGGRAGVTVGRLTLERLRAGAALQRRTQLPILVTGGLVGNNPPPVAVLMRDSLTQDFQVPVRWTEDRSRDTWQNARDSAAILRAAGIGSIYLVTNAWHERRALIAFAATGITVTAAPTPLDRPPTPVLADFLPRARTWETSYYALHEWVGCVWYALR